MKIFSTILIYFIFLGCLSPDKSLGEKVTMLYYEAFKKNDYDTILNLYSKDFYKTTPQNEWKDTLLKVKNKLGNILNYELISWKIKRYRGIGIGGIYYNFVYNVKYSNYLATEKITLYQLNNNDEIRILGHDIQSGGFIGE